MNPTSIQFSVRYTPLSACSKPPVMAERGLCPACRPVERWRRYFVAAPTSASPGNTTPEGVSNSR
jgi:hypothetical protein